MDETESHNVGSALNNQTHDSRTKQNVPKECKFLNEEVL